MKYHGLTGIKKYQRGFTLIEVVTVLAITGIIASGITVTIFQLYNVNSRSSAHMVAIKQVEDAVHWISRDVKMAQIVKLTEDPDKEDAAGTKFPLTLTWTDWESNEKYQVIYSIASGSQLRMLERQVLVNTDNVTSPVAHSIDPDSTKTNLDLTGNVLTLTITAKVVDGSRVYSESREVKIVPRSWQ